MRRFRWLLLIPLALALASCVKDSTAPRIGTLNVTPVALVPCPYWTPPLVGPQRRQVADCSVF